MTKRESYEQKTEELVLPIIEANHFELVDVEYVKEGGTWYLRAYIDKPGGITVDDCEIVNRALGGILDEKDFIEESYILEVSSPGLGRPLKKERDFERSLGEEVEIRTYRMVEKQKEFRGFLVQPHKYFSVFGLEHSGKYFVKTRRKENNEHRIAGSFGNFGKGKGHQQGNLAGGH